MKITYIKLENFLGIYAGTGRTELEVDFKNNKNKIIILNAGNGKGKTTLLSMLHPLRETYDDRKDIIIPGSLGKKTVDLIHNGDEYHIEHFYGKKNKSFISKNGDELNENGNITSFNEIAKEELGIDADYFKIGRIGSNVSNFIDLKSTDRKKYITEFIPSIDEYLEAFETIKDKYTSYNTQLKFIKNTIEKYSGMRDLNEIKADVTALTNEIELHEKKLIDVQLAINGFTSVKDSLEKDIEDYINDSGLYEESVSFSDLDNITMDIDEYTSEIEDNYNAWANKESEYLQKYKIRVEENVLEYITGLDKKFTDRIAKLTADITSIEENLKTLSSSKIEAQNKMNYYSEKLEAIEKDTISEEDVKLNKSAIESNLLEIKNAEAIIKAHSGRFKAKDLEALYDAYDNDFRMYTGEDIIDAIDVVKGNYDLSVLKAYYKEGDTFIYGKADYITKQKKLTAELKTLENKIGTLEGKLSYVDETLPKRSSNCKDDSCSFIKSALEIDKICRPEFEASIKRKEEIIKELDEIEEIISKCDTYITISNSMKAINDKIRDKFPVYFRNQIATHKLLIEDNSMLLENIGIYDFQKIYTNRNIIDNLTTTNETLKAQIESYNMSEELIKEYETNFNSAKESINTITTSISELKEELADKNTAKENAEKRSNICKDYFTIYKELSEYREKYNYAISIQKKLKSLIDKYNKFKEENDVDSLNATLSMIQSDISELKTKLEENNTSVTIIEDNMAKLSEIEGIYNSVVLIKDALDPKKGIPVVFANEYLKSIATKTNKLLKIAYGDHFKIRFNITAKDFLVEVYKSDGTVLTDIKLASQGETSLTNVSLSLAMLECMIKKYNIVYLDEVDCTLSTENRKLFIELLENQMDTLNIEQCFVISHNNEFYDKNVDLILLEDHDCPTSDPDFMAGKNIILEI